jgi:TolB-like protein
MGGESPKPEVILTGAVFLSYASEDAESAERIATALGAAGIEVWFDREALRGGDAWDQKIGQQILNCRLFVPIISANTETRLEGYFRREWKLATDRTESMASELAFLFPVVIDSTPNTSAHVPDKFRHVQWTRLASGPIPPAFVERVRRLLSPKALTPQAATWVRRGSDYSSISAPPLRRSWRSNPLLWIAGVVLAMALGYIAVVSTHLTPRMLPATQTPAPPQAITVAFNPPPNSIAVLPFVNISGDKDQEYFSEGLTEELLNSLSRINELQVAARTSSFSFQGEHPDIAMVAHKLNVGAVLEGSVRRSAHTVRVTTQLVNGVTGFHMWSQSYDRNLGDVLLLQADLATAVASALRVQLLGDVAAKIEVSGTRNAAAMDAYLRATQALTGGNNGNDFQTAIAGYTKAIELDPNYALAYVGRSLSLQNFANFATSRDLGATVDKAEADAHTAIELAPGLGFGHFALAGAFESALDFGRASAEYERAYGLEPGRAQIVRNYGLFAVSMGKQDAGLAALHRAVALDPLNVDAHNDLGQGLTWFRRYHEALEVLKRAETLDPEYPFLIANIGIANYLLGDYEGALNACKKKPDDDGVRMCLAITYDKLGMHADAEAAYVKFRASRGDAGAVGYAVVLGQWGQTKLALDALETAVRVHSPDLESLKAAPLLDPLRTEPRFQAMERALKFPD